MEKSQISWKVIAVCAIVAVLLANIIPLIYFPHTRLGFDWDFESVSLFLKSSMIHYHKFPIHDPWSVGGVDLFTNPQSRVLSPTLILDLFFNPTYANFLITVLWGLVGFWGFYKLLKFYNVSDVNALIFSTIFLNGSYFGLHFSEGHGSFASWQALGLIFYLILNVDKIKYLFFYCMFMTFLMLEGHIHVLFFSQIILVVCLAFNINNISKNIIKNYRSYLPHLLVLIGICALIACIRVVPAMMLYAKRAPIIDNENMSLYLILRSFFDPFQYVVKNTHLLIHPLLDPKPRFHEYGSYLGIVSVVILAIFVFKKKFFKENWKIILLSIAFFWIGSGWLEIINPWKIFTKIPILNNAHVPSRLFIVVNMLVLILLAKIFDGWRNKPIRYWGLIAFLLIEAVFVRNYPFYKMFTLLDSRPHLNELITNNNIDQTLYYGKIPYYYYQQNTAAKTTYDPAKFDSQTLSSYDTNYRGEIFECPDGADKIARKDNLKITSYTPGEIHIKYDLGRPGCIQLNTNNLLGWNVVSGNARVVSKAVGQLLTLNTNDSAGEAIIKYQPHYLKWVIMVSLLGIVLAIIYWRRVIASSL